MLFDSFSALLGRQRPEMVPVEGARLTRCGERAWIADRELLYNARHRLPVRMLVLGDGEGGLCLYSPVALDDGTVEAVAGLGPVSNIVAPNRFHTLFVADAMDLYPQATLLLPPHNGGLKARYGPRAVVLDGPARVGSEIALFTVHLRQGLEELTLYHDSSELLAVADLFFNLRRAHGVAGWGDRLNGVHGKPALSRLQRLLLLKDLESLGEFYHWALNKPFSRLSMAHGQILASQAREVFYRLFQEFGNHRTGQ